MRGKKISGGSGLIEQRRLLQFLLKLDETIEMGEYKIKVVVRKDEQKTAKELIVPIYLRHEDAGGSEQNLEPLSINEKKDSLNVKSKVETIERELPFSSLELPKSQGIVIYEANKAKHTIPYFLALTFGLLVVLLGWRKG